MPVTVLSAFVFLLIKSSLPPAAPKQTTENTYKTGATLIPILQLRKLRKRKIRQPGSNS